MWLDSHVLLLLLLLLLLVPSESWRGVLFFSRCLREPLVLLPCSWFFLEEENKNEKMKKEERKVKSEEKEKSVNKNNSWSNLLIVFNLASGVSFYLTRVVFNLTRLFLILQGVFLN